jgi:hypothetical protein
VGLVKVFDQSSAVADSVEVVEVVIRKRIQWPQLWRWCSFQWPRRKSDDSILFQTVIPVNAFPGPPPWFEIHLHSPREPPVS